MAEVYCKTQPLSKCREKALPLYNSVKYYRPIFLITSNLPQKSVDKNSKVWHITSAPNKSAANQTEPLQPKKHNYFNFAESKREAEETQEVCLAPTRGQTQPKHTMNRYEAMKRTSSIEDGVDALALKADEGRGDRRNVQGELHASHEP
jgi:hypothetical protein